MTAQIIPPVFQRDPDAPVEQWHEHQAPLQKARFGRGLDTGPIIGGKRKCAEMADVEEQEVYRHFVSSRPLESIKVRY